MKPHERRAIGAYPFFKLQTYDFRSCCYRVAKRTTKTLDEAVSQAINPGRYRITRFDEDGTRTELEPFEVGNFVS